MVNKLYEIIYSMIYRQNSCFLLKCPQPNVVPTTMHMGCILWLPGIVEWPTSSSGDITS